MSDSVVRYGYLLLSLEYYNKFKRAREPIALVLRDWIDAGVRFETTVSPYNRHHIRLYMSHPDFIPDGSGNNEYQLVFSVPYVSLDKSVQVRELRMWNGNKFVSVKEYE